MLREAVLAPSGSSIRENDARARTRDHRPSRASSGLDGFELVAPPARSYPALGALLSGVSASSN